MEILACTIQDLLEQEISLYKELQCILENEKSHIVAMDIDSLWETISQKKKIFLQLEPIDKRVLNLLEKRSVELSMKSKSLKLSDFIEKLSVPIKTKSKLKKIKLGLEKYRKNVSTLALTNKTYIIESLSVINDIVTTVVDTVNKKQYNNYGNLSDNSETKRFISAEV
jgi:flagellar biosynthesis/type III secretory pathway chaperone